METRYEPQGVETRWQETWEREGAYNSDPAAAGHTFGIAHPPPNVTGELHKGHALPLAITDARIRGSKQEIANEGADG